MATTTRTQLENAAGNINTTQLAQKKETQQQLNIRTQTVGAFTIVTYLSGTQAIVEDKHMLHELAQCYCDVFNESWGESWTIETAQPVIEADLVPKAKRHPIAALLYHTDKIVGFCWGVMTDADDINEETDMPFGLPKNERIRGAQVAKYWLKNIVKKSRSISHARRES